MQKNLIAIGILLMFIFYFPYLFNVDSFREHYSELEKTEYIYSKGRNEEWIIPFPHSEFVSIPVLLETYAVVIKNENNMPVILSQNPEIIDHCSSEAIGTFKCNFSIDLINPIAVCTTHHPAYLCSIAKINSEYIVLNLFNMKGEPTNSTVHIILKQNYNYPFTQAVLTKQ